jgi:hypothetical protein
VARISTQTAALMPIRAWETTPPRVGRSPPYGVRPLRMVLRPSATHDGHWNPTAASFMQSGQIGRSQRWQRT